MSKLGLIILIVVSAFVIMAGFFIINFSGEDYDEDDNIYCTQDAKLCPDGSYVGRTGPNCEFADCPESDEEEFKTTGTVVGKVSIGPLCPVEPCPEEFENPYLSRQLIFIPKGGGRPVDLPFYAKLDKDGGFTEEIPYGNYEVNLSDCDYLGCEYSLPKLISVEANKTLELTIDIDTGIR